MWESIRNTFTEYSGGIALGIFSSGAILTAVIFTAPITGLAVTVLTAVTATAAVVGGVAAGVYLVKDRIPAYGDGRPMHPEQAKPINEFATWRRDFVALEERLVARLNATDKKATDISDALSAHMALSATDGLAINRKIGELRIDTDANTNTLRRRPGLFASQTSVSQSTNASNDDSLPSRSVRRGSHHN